MSTEKSYNIYQDYLTVPASNLTLSKNVEHYLYLKRVYDIFLATVGLFIGLPVVVLFTILIVIETPGSPFYVQERIGKNGKRFKMVKLRSMRMDAEKEGAKWAEVNDPRITKVGALIRKTRIDELPQLVSVLKGDMSIVGPRPERPFFTAKFNKEIKGFENRLLVKPGLTGLAQVSGGYDISPREKLKYDLEYIQNLTFSLEVKIILKTFKVILTGEGAR
ncbi:MULTISPECIES: sugar transferase [unclassified Bacillus (in: firmicutes)]|uniref:sugar transferase n=1 Tax=unclassified Bacillus (in: firmicutes) TaxID=185979 RepID=UPI001BE6E4E7|nr:MULTISPECIES: sugar transferase [unclassified Bacillus (in: firmicutes)]MBT2725207.1 sugar transferase [Bacillus sp. ISL-46]MBT2744437.1 sugar transferase [Bacillus sp. ISL-77]